MTIIGLELELSRVLECIPWLDIQMYHILDTQKTVIHGITPGKGLLLLRNRKQFCICNASHVTLTIFSLNTQPQSKYF